ncbi:UNVERIFIED_CONTAM: hypothetical protein K2H54_047417 [Gekko kuhli]
MTESTEQEPTRSCGVLTKACEEEHVLFVVVHTVIETVSSTMLVLILVERQATSLKSVASCTVILHLKSSVIQKDLQELSHRRALSVPGRCIFPRTCSCHLQPKRLMVNIANHFPSEQPCPFSHPDLLCLFFVGNCLLLRALWHPVYRSSRNLAKQTRNPFWTLPELMGPQTSWTLAISRAPNMTGILQNVCR